MGLLLKLHLSSYVTRNIQDFSITTNTIVLFLSRVSKYVILICLMTTLPTMPKEFNKSVVIT